MKETRRLDIKKKVLTKTDILNIGRVFLREYENVRKSNNYSSIEFNLSCVDGTSYESESLELFDDGGILDTKKIRLLGITFYYHNSERHMDIRLVHGGGYDDGLLVKGDDRNWVNGVFTRLTEIIKSIKPQDNWIIRHRTLVLHLMALGIGSIFCSVLGLLADLYIKIDPPQDPSENVKKMLSFFKTYPFLIYLVRWGTIWLTGMLWAYQARRWLLNLWPDIEFDFGPEHMKEEKQRRSRIWLASTLAVIPTVLVIVQDLVKHFLAK